MGAAYQSVSISGYNNSPPPDDGTTVAANKITWNSTIKTKLTDPLNTFAAAINSQLNTWSDFSSVTTSTNLTTNASHHMQTIEVTSGSPTIQLGDAATMTKNYVVTVTNTGTGAPVIALATGANTLDGTAAGTFTFPTGTHTSFTFKVNNGATGYYTEKNGGKTILAQTSVITPLVGTNTAATASLIYNNAQVVDWTSSVFVPHSDNAVVNGSSTNRWSAVFTPTLDSGTTGSLSLQTHNGTVGLQILDTSSGARNVTIASSAAGNPTISTTAGNLAIGVPIAGTSGTVALAGASSVSGTGISFPGTQSASSDVNTLDDYEEGTWVPSLGGNTTYTTQAGKYVKVGNIVFIDCKLVINAIGTGSTTQVSGLPFTVSSANTSTALSVLVGASSATSIVSASAAAISGGTTLSISSRTAASTGDSANPIFQNSTVVVISGCYSV